jgi:hypothetical protein
MAELPLDGIAQTPWFGWMLWPPIASASSNPSITGICTARMIKAYEFLTIFFSASPLLRAVSVGKECNSKSDYAGI